MISEATTSRYGIRGVSHQYAIGVPVLTDVDFELTAGSVHSLVGENGSGKSTLIKLLTGVLKPQVGELHLDGAPLSLSSPGDAQHHGLGVVHQDYHLFADLSVAQNIMGVGGSLPRHRSGRVDKRRIEAQVSELLERFGIDLAPDARVRSLDPAERKFVEIARAMRMEPRFLILDEPTASLEPQGSQAVLDLLDRLRANDVGLCFVSHRLNEVMAISDRLTVLRDGRLVDCIPAAGLTEERMVEMIVGGEDPRAQEAQRAPATGMRPVVLRTRDVRLQAHADSHGLELREGEILGLTGLLGSGAATVVRMLGGAEPLRGEVEVDGRPAAIRSPRDAGRLGIGFIPEDRKGAGVIPDQSVAVNVSLASLDAVTRFGVVSRQRMRERASSFGRQLDIRARSVESAVNTLSGGNLQKVLIAKWLASGRRILAIEEPTHGIDIGAKAQVHRLLREFVDEGGAIVVALSDVHEALELCDRIAVFRHCALVDVLSSDALTSSQLTAMGATERLETLVEGGAPVA
jgi:ABC-type sugar transport system ATPase subunit